MAYLQVMRPHRRANNRRIRELERNPLWEVTSADHTDDYPQPEEVDGNIPDYKAESIFGETLIGETERCGDNSLHSRNQQDAFGQSARRRPDRTFELNEYGCEINHEPDFGIGLDFGMDFGLGDNKQSSRKRSDSGGLFDFF